MVTTTTTPKPAFGEFVEYSQLDVLSGAWWYPAEAREAVRSAYLQRLQAAQEATLAVPEPPAAPAPEPAEVPEWVPVRVQRPKSNARRHSYSQIGLGRHERYVRAQAAKRGLSYEDAHARLTGHPPDCELYESDEP